MGLAALQPAAAAVGKKNMPPPGDYKGASEEESKKNAQLNRPNSSTPFASQQWTQDANGNWQVDTGLSGGLGAAAGEVGDQAHMALSQPLDLSGLPQLDSGEGARDQAIKAAYGQATSRLDPQWTQRDEQLRQRLANQGLDPDSEAGKNATHEFGQERNDAYGSAMNSAIGQGTAAGNSVFQNSLMARQTALAEALRKRGQPLAELGALQGLMQQPQFNQVQGPQYLNASMAQSNDAWRAWQAQQQQQADMFGGIGDLAGAAGQALPFML